MELEELLRALVAEESDVPCGEHPADLLAAAIGEARISGHRSIEMAA